MKKEPGGWRILESPAINRIIASQQNRNGLTPLPVVNKRKYKDWDYVSLDSSDFGEECSSKDESLFSSLSPSAEKHHINDSTINKVPDKPTTSILRHSSTTTTPSQNGPEEGMICPIRITVPGSLECKRTHDSSEIVTPSPIVGVRNIGIVPIMSPLIQLVDSQIQTTTINNFIVRENSPSVLSLPPRHASSNHIDHSQTDSTKFVRLRSSNSGSGERGPETELSQEVYCRTPSPVTHCIASNLHTFSEESETSYGTSDVDTCNFVETSMSQDSHSNFSINDFPDNQQIPLNTVDDISESTVDPGSDLCSTLINLSNKEKNHADIGRTQKEAVDETDKASSEQISSSIPCVAHLVAAPSKISGVVDDLGTSILVKDESNLIELFKKQPSMSYSYIDLLDEAFAKDLYRYSHLNTRK